MAHELMCSWKSVLQSKLKENALFQFLKSYYFDLGIRQDISMFSTLFPDIFQSIQSNKNISEFCLNLEIQIFFSAYSVILQLIGIDS